MNSCRECKHYKKDERIGIIVCEFGIQESYCEKDKEDFAIEELEKIKAEIKGEMNNPVELAKNRALYWVLEIIDKHISELKGE